MDELSILNRIQESLVEKDGRKALTCPAAFKIAEEIDSDIAEIGKICHENKIKIVKCQLGCF